MPDRMLLYSLTTGIKEAARQVQQRAGSGGINYLVQTQGQSAA